MALFFFERVRFICLSYETLSCCPNDVDDRMIYYQSMPLTILAPCTSSNIYITAFRMSNFFVECPGVAVSV